ncbi:hypothetical protein AB0C38_36815 [Amycolatopsis sp. NPDC048633]|uniref:hypothetical protein n=1 Tax=Amycolatopsis sp. NPDC048633 TaxID=3157095 RepID=UPI0033E5660B
MSGPWQGGALVASGLSSLNFPVFAIAGVRFRTGPPDAGPGFAERRACGSARATTSGRP